MNLDYIHQMTKEKEKRSREREQRKSRNYVDGTCIPSLTQKVSKNSKTGIKGVRWDKDRLKWAASIYFKGKCYQLGRFDDINDAVKARQLKEEELFGPYRSKEKEEKNV